MLAAPLLRKQTVKNATLEIINAPPPPPHSHEHVKEFLSKCTVLKADSLQDHLIYCLQACMCEPFRPEMLQAGAVKGLKL